MAVMFLVFFCSYVSIFIKKCKVFGPNIYLFI